MKVAVVISPNWRDYGKKYLQACLESLRSQSFKDFHIFLIDNETSEESFSFLKEQAGEATIIRLSENAGFAGGNNAALKKALEQNFEFVFLLNMDARVETDCLEILINAAHMYPQAAAFQPRIMLWPEKELVNSLGNESHFLGFGFCRGYRSAFNPDDNKVKEIAYASGAGVLIRTADLKRFGLFDEKLWMYNEDQDLCSRFGLAGRSTLIVPTAVVYHEYEFSRSISKYYWMDRNRLIVIWKHYRLLTLVLVAPALIAMELGLAIFSIQSGWLSEKLKVWFFFLNIFNWPYLIKARRETQQLRTVSDRRFTKYFSGRIWYQEIDDIKLRLINPVFNVYWRVIRLIMFW